MLITAFFVAVIFITITYLLIKYNECRNYWKDRGINGPTPIPIIGNLWRLYFTSVNELEEKMLQKYGPVYGTFKGSTPVLTISDPQLIKEVAIIYCDKFQNRHNYFTYDKLVSTSLFFMKDTDAKRVRDILSPLFSASKVRKMTRRINECVDNTLTVIEQISESKHEIDLKKIMLSYMVDVIAQCAFRIDICAYKDLENIYVNKLLKAFKVHVWRIATSMIIPAKIQRLFDMQVQSNETLAFLASSFEQLKEERVKNGMKQKDVLNSLLNSVSTDEANKNNGLTEFEVVSQCATVFVAATEPTSTLLQFMLYVLATNSEVQQKLYEEINVFMKKGESLKIVDELPYLDAVVNEVLRRYSPTVHFGRVCNEDCVIGENIKINKGTFINVALHAMNHDPQYFPDPYCFDPERFLLANKSKIHPYTFLPFGIGRRSCIGTRFSVTVSKIFIVKLLYKFEIVNSKSTPKTPEIRTTTLMLASKPMFVSFRKRF